MQRALWQRLRSDETGVHGLRPHQTLFLSAHHFISQCVFALSPFSFVLTGICANKKNRSMPLLRIIQQHATRALLSQAATAAFSTQVGAQSSPKQQRKQRGGCGAGSLSL